MSDVETLVLGMFLGMVALALFILAWRRLRRALGMPRTVAEYRADLERDVIALVEAQADAAACEAAVVDRIGRMPDQFDPVLIGALNYARAVQRELVLEHERRGIVPAGTHDRVFGVEEVEAQERERVERDRREEEVRRRRDDGVGGSEPPPAYGAEASSDVESARLPSNVRRLPNGKLLSVKRAVGVRGRA